VTVLSRESILALVRERILSFAASRMQREAAEDLTQEALVLLHEKYAHVEAIEELIPLALKILRFKMASSHRKMVRRGESTQIPVDDLALASADPGPDELYERRARAERLSAALAELGPRCKELFRLKMEGRGFEEIRIILGAGNINTVYTWDFRCRKQLLERLGGSYEEFAGPAAREAAVKPRAGEQPAKSRTTRSDAWT
jgi:RNA polymerase sigma-70 factor, ECF subfamily